MANEEDIQEGTKQPTNTDLERRSTNTLGTILQLIDAIWESEVRLRGQLHAIADSMDVDGDTPEDQQTRWRRAVQLFGNRVYELKGEERQWGMPEWVNAATAVISSYVPDSADDEEERLAQQREVEAEMSED